MREAYFVHDVFEGVGAVNCEADEEEVCFWIGEGPEAVVLFLSRGVPEGELDCFASGFVLCLGDVVFEDCGDVFLMCLLSALLWMS